MTYMVDLSGDLENNETFLLLKNLLLQIKKDSKEETNKALLLLLKSIFTNGMGDIENEEIKNSISAILGGADAPPNEPEA